MHTETPVWPLPPESVRILLVDDDGQMLLLLRSTLFQLDHTNVVTARDASSAQRELEQQRIDVVFLDIDLAAETSGLDLLERWTTRPTPPFIVMFSANSTAANFQRAMRSGAGYFVVKPFNGAKIRAALQRYHQAKTAAAA